MTDELLLGIDIGGTNIRAVLFSSTGEQIFRHAMPTAPAYVQWDDPTKPDIALDGELLWQIVSQVCLEIGNYIHENSLILRGIAVAGVGCSTVCVDQNDQVLFPIYRYFTGGDQVYQQYVELLGAETYYEITGYPLEQINLAFSLAHFKNDYPHKYAQIEAVLSVSDFINLKLCGERSWENSTATSLGFWDHRNNSWWEQFLNHQELDANQFGEPVWGGTKIGVLRSSAAESTNLPLGTPIVSGGHDYLCAALAAGCIQKNSLLNIIGTYEIVASFHDVPQTGKFTRGHRTFMDKHVVPNLYSFSTERVGSIQFDWVRDLIAPHKQLSEKNWAVIYNEIKQLPAPFQHTKEIFIPYVLGQLFPHHKPYVKGGFVGVSEASTAAALLRAAIEAMCFESKRMVNFHTDLFSGFDQIVAVGGASRSDDWLQIKANILNTTIQTPNIVETTAFGAALLAGIGTGVYQNATEAVKIAANQSMREFTPQPEVVQLYADVYQQVYLPLTQFTAQIDFQMEEISKKYYDQI
jgi:sugar (pentulose or hexulose) kinase